MQQRNKVKDFAHPICDTFTRLFILRWEQEALSGIKMPIVQQKTQKERQCIPQSCCAPAPQSPLQGWPLNRWDVGGTSEGPDGSAEEPPAWAGAHQRRARGEGGCRCTRGPVHRVGNKIQLCHGSLCWYFTGIYSLFPRHLCTSLTVS